MPKAQCAKASRGEIGEHLVRGGPPSVHPNLRVGCDSLKAKAGLKPGGLRDVSFPELRLLKATERALMTEAPPHGVEQLHSLRRQRRALCSEYEERFLTVAPISLNTPAFSSPAMRTIDRSS
mmetsp:Transcript_22626/g.37378  ORF Transcript_22626/g.37378 Transcript_22626/m.37378 type:complete len:122 (+) Transcript_22626:640-1005(+)